MNQDQGIYFFHQGTNYYSYKLMGAHFQDNGVIFRVWAPKARKVSVIGEFNYWDRYAHPMKKINEQGIWEVFIPGVQEYNVYRYAILNSRNRWTEKSDRRVPRPEPPSSGPSHGPARRFVSESASAP